MLSALPFDRIRALLFGTALLAAMLGFGLFFDHLADMQDQLLLEATQAAMADEPSI